MLKVATGITQTNNFDLKQQFVELIRLEGTPGRASISMESLEAMRTARPAIPASKHSLEIICGASCETGAV